MANHHINQNQAIQIRAAFQYMIDRYSSRYSNTPYAIEAVSRLAALSNVQVEFTGYLTVEQEQLAAQFSPTRESEMCLRCGKSFAGLIVRRFETHLGHYCGWTCFKDDNYEVVIYEGTWSCYERDEKLIYDTAVNDEEWQCIVCKAINPNTRGKCWLCGH